MATLPNRLEKLETDLNMLTAIRHLLLDADLISDRNSEDLDIPTRDTPIKKPGKVTRKCPAKNAIITLALQKPSEIHGVPKHPIRSNEIGGDPESNQEQCNEMDQKLVQMEEKIGIEEQKPLESEDYRERFASQLQKV